MPASVLLLLLQITGDTIFNAAKFGDLDVDDSDRPLDPPKVISVEVKYSSLIPF